MSQFTELANDLKATPERAEQLLDEYIEKTIRTNQELEFISSALTRALKLFETVKADLETTPELLPPAIATGNALAMADRAVKKLAQQLQSVTST